MRDSRRGPLAWFAANHVAANILMVFILASGALALARVVIEVFPEIETDTITIRVPYRGATPAEAEEGVCVRVEEAIASIEGIKRVRAVAQENLGTVVVELDEDADDRKVLDDVKAAVDRIETFPVETEKPIVSETDTRRRVITVVLHGKASEKTLKALAERVRDELTARNGVSMVEIAGVRSYEISIEVSEEALRRYGLSFDQVASAVATSSLDLPGGAVKTKGGEILLRTKGQRYRGAEFESIVVVTRPDGTQVRLDDVATVVDGFEDTDTVSRFDGRRAALIQVYRVGDEGALEVTRLTKDYIAELAPSLPEGVEVDTWDDDSIILKQRIGLLLGNARFGLVLVFVCLALFLDMRLAFWATMGIPISFLGGLWLLPQFGVTINMISLFAFIVVLGIVVDDAIVVGENIFNYLESGMKPIDAAVRGVREMAMPVTFAVLTTVAAFAPLLFVDGRMGKVMYQIPLVVIMVLVTSLVEALLILPAHLSGDGALFHRVVGPILGPVERVQARVQDLLRRWIAGPYRSTLSLALEWRYLTVALSAVVLLLSVALVAGGFVKFSFMPKVDADNMIALLTMPQGTPVEQTEAVLARIENAAVALAAEVDEGQPDDSPSVLRHVSTTVGQHPTGAGHGPMAARSSGGDSSHLGEVNIELLGAEDRSVSSADLVRRWREMVGEVPGAVSLTFQANLFSAGDPISVQLSHRDFDVLLAAVERLKGTIAEYPGARDVADSFLAGKKELKLSLTPEGRASGLTLSDLARQVRAGFYGQEVQRVQRGRDDIRVMVRYPEEERRSRGDIDAMRIRLPDGSEVPFTTVAEVEEGRGYAVINRTDRRRVVTVTADVEESVANANEISADLRGAVLPALVDDFPGLSFDFEGEQREQRESLDSMKLNFVVAQLAIFALLAIPFRSYIQPLIIMSAIPFGLIGAVLGHMLMGLDLTMLSMFGMVALSGVVVNDSLILIDLVNRMRAEGASVDQAVREAGERRFRPIILTTATTFLGLTPMIFETSMQARFLVPMAVSLGYGIVFATAITLILVPVLYRIVEDVRALAGVADPDVRVSRQIREGWAGGGETV
ncbi:MAG: efflux RND transporter permease subunit [Thermoanaerobaculales bacterium]|jgi:multidrug efflux pump subunit AcrB|nr:efflux RND transporter permease subunit [Thermoanaerobaculales bacterium]